MWSRTVVLLCVNFGIDFQKAFTNLKEPIFLYSGIRKSFNHQIFIENLLYVRYCGKYNIESLYDSDWVGR